MSDSNCRFWGDCDAPASSRGWCSEHSYMPASGTCEHPDGCVVGDDGGAAPVLAKGLCSTHHARWANTGELGPGGRLTRRNEGPCRHPDGCLNPSKTQGWCRTHYARVRRLGDPGPVGLLKAANGEGNLDSRGYVRLTVNNQRIQQHRLVIEQILGRPLRDFENVHHINGIRDDNRPENLELWVKAQPAGQRARDLAEWVIETYPELVEAVLADRRQLRLVN